MNREEFHAIIKDGIYKLNEYSTSNYMSRLEAIQSIGNTIRQELGIEEFNLGLEAKSKKVGSEYKAIEYVTCTFNSNNRKYFATYLYDNNTFEDRLFSLVQSIVNGIKAIQLINEYIIDTFNDAGSKNQYIVYSWGYRSKCQIGRWDYSSMEIVLSAAAVQYIADLYESGENTFIEKIKSLVKESNIDDLNIVTVIKNFRNIKIHSEIGAKLDDSKSTQELIKEGMLSREEAIDWLSNHKESSGVRNITVLEIVDELGNFAALESWRIDYTNKTVEFGLKNEQVLDIDNASIMSNYAICSRIEQRLRLSDAEKQKLV